MCNMDKYLWEQQVLKYIQTFWMLLEYYICAAWSVLTYSCGGSNCTVLRVCLCVCMCASVFGPFSSFKSWSRKLVVRAPVFNKTRYQSTEGKRGTNSRIQGTFSHIRLVLHFLWNLRESTLVPIQSYAMNADKIGKC